MYAIRSYYEQDKIMQVKIEDQSSIKKVLSFEIPKETISKELNKAYADLNKSYNFV